MIITLAGRKRSSWRQCNLFETVDFRGKTIGIPKPTSQRLPWRKDFHSRRTKLFTHAIEIISNKLNVSSHGVNNALGNNARFIPQPPYILFTPNSPQGRSVGLSIHRRWYRQEEYLWQSQYDLYIPRKSFRQVRHILRLKFRLFIQHNLVGTFSADEHLAGLNPSRG